MENLKAGEKIFYSGLLYTARDQAHKRLHNALLRGKKLSFDIKGKIIYYCGPANTPKGRIIGSCGPTTSARMDEFTPFLLKAGLRATIGKGARSKEVINAIKEYKAPYFVTYAGCGALLSTYVRNKKIVGFKDFGPEAIYELEVRNFPLIVAVDAKGKSIY